MQLRRILTDDDQSMDRRGCVNICLLVQSLGSGFRNALTILLRALSSLPALCLSVDTPVETQSLFRDGHQPRTAANFTFCDR